MRAATKLVPGGEPTKIRTGSAGRLRKPTWSIIPAGATQSSVSARRYLPDRLSGKQGIYESQAAAETNEKRAKKKLLTFRMSCWRKKQRAALSGFTRTNSERAKLPVPGQGQSLSLPLVPLKLKGTN